MNHIINTIFPSSCVVCKRVGEPICKHCIKNKIFVNWDTYCCVCNSRVKRGLIHEECKDQTYLDGHFFVVSYSEGIKELIMNGKYSFMFYNFEFIGELMSKFIRFYNLNKDSIFAPVPLTRRKKRIRGFNQSEVIASKLARDITYINLLNKIKDIPSQATLGGEERRINLKDSFQVNTKLAAKLNTTQKVILIDDVYTTGSTLNECAKALKEYGFKEVLGFTFAKGGRF